MPVRSPVFLGVILMAALSTLPLPAQGHTSVIVYHLPDLSGPLTEGSPSQLLPSTALVFRFSGARFPQASEASPVVIELGLPKIYEPLQRSVTLTTTLATGDLDTPAPYPLPDGSGATPTQTVVDLALVEFEPQYPYLPTHLPRPINLASFPDLPRHSVQILRWVAGEDRILLRINYSPMLWPASQGPPNPDRFIGFALFLGGGVWPSVPGTSFGPQGVGQQPSTLLYADVREFDFRDTNFNFLIYPWAYEQFGGGYVSHTFEPYVLPLFAITEPPGTPERVEQPIGGELTDTVIADLNRDGLDDVVSIDQAANRLYWALGLPEGGFGPPSWIEEAAMGPIAVFVLDITGDGHPDIVIHDQMGALVIFDGLELLAATKSDAPPPAPLLFVTLPGTPSATALADLNNDGFLDYLYTDPNDNSLNVRHGSSLFSDGDRYTAGSHPADLVTADFNNDGHPDVAVVSTNDGSLHVFLNTGTGQLTGTPLPGVGSSPVAVTAADLNRNGHTELVVGLRVDKALRLLWGQADGSFSLPQGHMLYLPHTPAVLLADNYDGEDGPDVLVAYSDYHRLAFCTLNHQGLLREAYEIDMLADVLVDPFGNLMLPEDGILSVGGGTGYGGVSSRQGVASIQQMPFNILHFPRSREISFSVVNLSPSPALINMELYTDGGAIRGGATRAIPARHQFARYFDEFFGPESAHPDRWVRSFISQTAATGIWFVNDPADMDYLDGAKIPDIRDAQARAVFPTVLAGGGASTTLFLINPQLQATQVALTARAPNGTIRATHHLLIPARGRLEQNAVDLLAGLQTNDWIHFDADRPVIGYALLSRAGQVAVLPAMRPDPDAVNLFCPHVAHGQLGVNYVSHISLVNTGSTPAQYRLFVYGDTGTLTDQTFSPLQLPAYGATRLPIRDFFTIPRDTYSGYLVLQSEQAGQLVGSITFGDAAGTRFLSALPFQSTGHRRFFMGHIANGTLGSIPYFTGLAILNPDNLTQTITLNAFGPANEPLASQTFPIPARNRSVFLLHDRLPGLTSIFGGYLTVTSQAPNGNLHVFQLMGDTTLRFLSAVPAIPRQ